jgi:hypothetical protein
MGDLIRGTLPGMMRVGLAALWLAAFAGMGSGAAAEPLLETTRGLFARGRFVIGALVVQRGGREQRLVVHLHYRGPAHLLARVKGSPRLDGTVALLRDDRLHVWFPRADLQMDLPADFGGERLFGSDAEIRIAERQAAQGRRNPRISRQLGIRALSRRNWARAAEHFDRVLEAHPRFARIRQLSRFATCMADPSRTAAQACSLAREAGSEEPDS